MGPWVGSVQSDGEWRKEERKKVLVRTARGLAFLRRSKQESAKGGTDAWFDFHPI